MAQQPKSEYEAITTYLLEHHPPFTTQEQRRKNVVCCYEALVEHYSAIYAEEEAREKGKEVSQDKRFSENKKHFKTGKLPHEADLEFQWIDLRLLRCYGFYPGFTDTSKKAKMAWEVCDDEPEEVFSGVQAGSRGPDGGAGGRGTASSG